MNRKIMLAGVGVLFAAHAFGQSPFILRFKTTDIGKNDNTLCAYVETSSGAYVDTFGVYGKGGRNGTKYFDELRWHANSGINSFQDVPADAKVGVTRPDFNTPSIVKFDWDLKDSSGNMVPDGTYRIHLSNAHEGSDRYGSFTFVKDGNAGTRSVANFANFTSISIEYTPVGGQPNTAPEANAQTVAVVDGKPTPITLTGSDVEDNPLTFSMASAYPGQGLLSGIPPNFVYYPPTEVNATETFSFRVNDGSLSSAPATVTLNISFTDSDGDGMPDSWENENGLNVAVNDAEADADGDGFSNYGEFIALTDPNDPQSGLGFKLLPLDGLNSLQWATQIGCVYDLFWTTNLTSGWNQRGFNMPASKTSDIDYTTEGTIFYQLRAERSGDAN